MSARGSLENNGPYWTLLHPVWLWVIRKEERAMEEEFGEAWREYAGRTGCFVPRVRSLLGR